MICICNMIPVQQLVVIAPYGRKWISGFSFKNEKQNRHNQLLYNRSYTGAKFMETENHTEAYYNCLTFTSNFQLYCWFMPCHIPKLNSYKFV